MPALRAGDAPAKTGVEAVQSFTQPPPRYSEASLVKRLEELGIGRPSTYAATLQTLKDREYVRLEKQRFIPEESGRLVTAFLERFFERYVSFDYTAEREEELDDVSGGRLGWQKMLEDFWRDFKPKAGEVMDQKPSEVTAALDDFLSPYLFPDKGDGSDPRLCPLCGTGRLGLRGGKFGAFVACSNYPDCKYTRRFGQGEEAASEGPAELGNGIELKSGRFGPYLERDGKRASLPKDVPQDGLTLEMAEKLLSLPREIGAHPETGLPIVASIGRYGPYLMHDGKYARLSSTAEVFDTGMNAAVVKLAEAAAGGGKSRGGSREPIAVLGAHPASGKEVKVMEGRFGPYVSDGEVHATLPKTADPKAVTLEEAAALIDAKAAKGPVKKTRRKPGTTGRKSAGSRARKG
jgi:DNA topoisomerase-1